jgi:hypothetical protein
MCSMRSSTEHPRPILEIRPRLLVFYLVSPVWFDLEKASLFFGRRLEVEEGRVGWAETW